MRLPELLASVLFVSVGSASWPSELDPIGFVRHEVEHLLQRQAASSSQFDLSFSGVQGNTATTITSAPTGTQTGSTDATTTGTGTSGGSNSAAPTGSGSGSNNTSSQSPQTQTFDPQLPAGGISMMTPNPQTTQYYKIGNYVTFGWNYTSLLATPSAVDILASCRSNMATYTIALNQTFKPSQNIVWDTNQYQSTATVPLLTETYTLIIHDAAKDISATPSSGYLATYEQFTFGMYVPQPYTPLAGFVCATCNSAMGLAERQTIGAMLIMTCVTVLSFSWFAGVAGLW